MEAKMEIEVPYTSKPEDVTRLLQVMTTKEVPKIKVDPGYLKSWGFSLSSSNYLFKILKMLGFVDEEDQPSASWIAYASDEKRGAVLATAIKNAYADLFKSVLCPYLESDEVLMDYLESCVKAKPKEMQLMVDAFRLLSETADFQDLLCVSGSGESTSTNEGEKVANVKVNPNLQLNIQIHIDPNTPEDKIEAIFKNMKKYLLPKDEQS
jgi:hypothetical protein